MALFFISISAVSEESIPVDLVKFVWRPDQRNPMRGKCFEVDKETGGKLLFIKTYRDKCRPENLAYQWVPNSARPGGKCYQVDATYGAQKYSDSVSASNCFPKDMHFQLLADGQCYAVDGGTGGQDFSLRVEKKKCRPKEALAVWIPLQSSVGGRCIMIDQETMGQVFKERVEEKHCRPEKTSFVWLASERNPLKGQCVELPLDGDRTKYSRKVAESNCVESEFQLKWLPNATGGAGSCLKISRTRAGQVVALPTKIEECKPENTKIVFQKKNPIKGDCYEVDSETSGQQWIKRLSIEKCKGEKLVNKVLEFRGKFYCVEVDQETGGEHYLKRLNDKKCNPERSPPVWMASPSDPWRGACLLFFRKLDGSLYAEPVKNEKCLPAKTEFRWRTLSRYQGRCYLVDADRGANGFSKKVEPFRCRPLSVKIVLLHDEKKGYAECYEVASHFDGDDYIIRVGKEKCRQKFVEDSRKRQIGRELEKIE
jgi:hypothetical protein